MLLADATVTVTPSGSWADPNSWPALIREIGVPGFFLLIAVLIVTFLVCRGCRALFAAIFGTNGCVFGEKGWVSKFYDRFCAFLTKIEALGTQNAETLEQQRRLCEQVHVANGPCNVEDMRMAGHSFAEMGRKIGQKVGVDVGPEADKIHDVLRTAISVSKPA